MARKPHVGVLEVRSAIHDALDKCYAGVVAPKQDRSKKRAAAVQAAAASLFESGNFRAARMSDIARLANVPVSSIYDYYPNKSMLIYSLLMAGLMEFYETLLEQITDALSVKACLDSALKLALSLTKRDPLATVFDLQLWADAIEGDSRIRPGLVAYYQMFADLIEIGARHGEWPTHEQPDLVAKILIGSISEHLRSARLLGTSHGRDELSVLLIHKLLRIVVSG